MKLRFVLLCILVGVFINNAIGQGDEYDLSDGSSSSAPYILSLNLPESSTQQKSEPSQPRPRFLSFLTGGSSNNGGRLTEGGSGTARLLESFRKFNLTGRVGRFRERISRFRLPKLETNDDSVAYRTGRRIGLFIQRVGKRVRSYAERLRARAATLTPTIQ